MEVPHLIILHGALGSAAQLEKLRLPFEEQYTTHTFDFQGHGSEAGKAFSIPLLAHQLNEFIHNQSIEKPFVFGYSMGGYVALYLEQIKPGSLAAICTLGTKFDWNPEASAREVKMLDPEVIKNKVPRFAEMLAQRHGSMEWEQVLKHTTNMMNELGVEPLLHESGLSTVKCPVLIGRGELDSMVGETESMWAAKSLYLGGYALLQGGEHPIEKCNTQEVFQFAHDFFTIAR